LGNPVVPDDQKIRQVSFLVLDTATGSGASRSLMSSNLATMSSTPSEGPKLKMRIFFLELSSMDATAFFTLAAVSLMQRTSFAFESLSCAK